MNNEKIVAIILARGGSKGIKNKNLIKINKKPMIFWSIKSCLKSKLINHVWVSSDDNKILKASKKFGANIIKRPKKYALDSSSSESAWLHAVNFLKKNYEFESVVGIQPTSPIRPYNLLDEAINKFKKNKYDSLFTSQKILDFNVWEERKEKLKANYDYKKRKRRQKIKVKYMENGSFYIFDKKKFLKHKCRLFGKIGTFSMDKIFSFQIDEKEDIKLFNLFREYF